MGTGLDDNPFQPGTGHVPAMLAGRDEETELLAEVIERLDGPRAEGQVKLAKLPFPPIKIVGPRGVGKTALLNWTKEQAAKKFMRFETCEGLKRDGANLAMQTMLENIAGGITKLVRRVRGFGLSLAGKAGMDVQMRKAELVYTDVVKAVVEVEPLLLLLDEVQHYDLALLGAVLQGSQKLIGEGYPLGLVMAGTPGLDSHLRKAESTFIGRSQNIYINTLSDAATQEALGVPFRQKGVKVTPAALKAMVAQTDNYPFFIQLVGRHAWKEMVRAGRESIDVKMVRRIQERARAGRENIYAEAYVRIRDNSLVPHARRVMELFKSDGGQVRESAVLKAIDKECADRDQALEALASLKEDGFIWTVRGRTSPGIPSFFTYFKEESEHE